MADTAIKTDGGLSFDYYYGMEAEQFSFYRVPRLLIKDKRFKKLSSDAKLLYGLMLDRMALSVKNGWFDAENRAYIYYTVENIMEDLGCSRGTCTKVLAELDCKKGIGLIEKKRQGLGKPDMIYVKNFVSLVSSGPEHAERVPSNTDGYTEVQNLDFRGSKNQISGSLEIELQEVQNLYFLKSKKQTSGSPKIESVEVQKLDPNYNNKRYTDISYTDSINQSEPDQDMMDDAHACIELIKRNIDYENHMRCAKWQDRELFDELFELICETVCVKRKTVKVNGEPYPYELVRSKFLKLNSSHLEYVISRMRETVTKITNIRSYMVTALYNAPNTIKHYYQGEVQYDMYGGGWEEKGVI